MAAGPFVLASTCSAPTLSRKNRFRFFLGLGAVLLLALFVMLGVRLDLGHVALARWPNPQLTGVTSPYRVGATVAGANGTTFQVSGSGFSVHAAVLLLLDTVRAPGSPVVYSDDTGAIRATVTVTAAWATGRHLLRARDASGYLTRAGWPLLIVPPGQAGTAQGLPERS
jgi:hypothetical protein